MHLLVTTLLMVGFTNPVFAKKPEMPAGCQAFLQGELQTLGLQSAKSSKKKGQITYQNDSTSLETSTRFLGNGLVVRETEQGMTTEFVLNQKCELVKIKTPGGATFHLPDCAGYLKLTSLITSHENSIKHYQYEYDNAPSIEKGDFRENLEYSKKEKTKNENLLKKYNLEASARYFGKATGNSDRTPINIPMRVCQLAKDPKDSSLKIGSFVWGSESGSQPENKSYSDVEMSGEAL